MTKFKGKKEFRDVEDVLGGLGTGSKGGPEDNPEIPEFPRNRFVKGGGGSEGYIGVSFLCRINIVYIFKRLFLRTFCSQYLKNGRTAGYLTSLDRMIR